MVNSRFKFEEGWRKLSQREEKGAMVRASKKKENGERSTSAPPNPEAEERKRLKKLAITKNILSQTSAKSSVHLNPSKVVLKHHGRDIVKKSQRKNKFLFSFPGLIAPLNGGKIGELKDLRTKNPILYLDFPQGQVKLFGTIVYPKNKYLTLQFSRGKNVSCEDYFDNMIVFSEAWWIGTKDENPEEVRLEFPKELTEGKDSDYDFKGGAGAGETCQEKPTARKVREETREETPEPQSPIISTPEDDDISEDSLKNLKDLIKVTPLRQSTRTAGRRFNFADPSSSGDDSAEGEAEMSEEEEKIVSEKPDDAVIVSAAKTEDSSLLANATGNENIVATTDLPGKSQQSSVSVKKLKETSVSKRGPLVQATIATLFKKVEKKSTGSSSKAPTLKAPTEKSGKTDLKRKSDKVEDEGPRNKGKVIKEKPSGRKTAAKQMESQTETEDTIEEISSESEDIEESDDDSCLIGEFMRGRSKGVGKSG